MSLEPEARADEEGASGGTEFASDAMAESVMRAGARSAIDTDIAGRQSVSEMSSPAEAVARTLVANLHAAGVRDVVLCPGSRSAPLAYALAEASRAGLIELHVRVDERGAGFVALGLAKVRGAAAVVTTSGTAVANLHPAVLEASHAGAGLIVISADRPAELRGTGANQTTRQPGIFGGSIRYDADLPADMPVASVRGQVGRAVAAARGALSRDPGPVHLNVQFREPLGPPRGPDHGYSARNTAESHIPVGAADAETSSGSCDCAQDGECSARDISEPPSPGLNETSVHAETVPIIVTPLGPGEPVLLDPGPRTVVVAGDGAGPEIAELAERANWPLFAEPSSNARTAHAITLYRDLLGSPLAERIERVIVAGHPTLSRPVSRLLARADLEIVVVSSGPRWTDVAGAATRVVPAIGASGDGDPAWLACWRDAEVGLSDQAPFTEHERLAQQIWDRGGNLVLGSSSTIRAFDSVETRSSPPRVWANRGLAGIDGTISTAIGVAHGLGGPVRVVLGDLTFLHDATALVRGVHEADADLQVIVFDDGGGSIFGTLEYGTRPDREFERIFATPQQMDVTALARSLGARALECTPDSLQEALAEPISGRSVLHVRLGRSQMAETLKRRREIASR